MVGREGLLLDVLRCDKRVVVGVGGREAVATVASFCGLVSQVLMVVCEYACLGEAFDFEILSMVYVDG